MEWVFLFLLVIIVAVIINVVAKSKAKKAMSAELKSIPGFTVSQEIMGEDAKTGFAYDENSSQICLVNKHGKAISKRVMQNRDILSVEVFEDGESVTKTARGSQLGGALLGGIVFGPLGAVVGGLSGKKKTENKVKRLDLRLAINDTSSPIHDVCFMDVEVKKSSVVYKNAYKNVTHWSAIIETLIKRADDDDRKKQQAGINDMNSVDVPGRIRELAKLREEGLITDEEYAAQKTKLLG